MGHWAHMGLLSMPYIGPLWASSYGLDRMGPIWVLYGLAHMGYLYELAIWAPHRSIMGSPYEIFRIGPIWVVYILFWA